MNLSKERLDKTMPFAVDCEWHGRTYVDGQLRTIQFAWTESDAVVIEFRNEQNEWSFELDEETMGDIYADSGPCETEAEERANIERNRYRRVGHILAGIMNRKDVRYIGHHFSADAPWMQHWLGLDTYRRCVMDTEFAQQTVDESSELGLERGIAMKYTTLGLYNLDLILWKKDNPGKTDGGYGFIPSEILHPYGALDVITPYRAYPLIRRQLDAQQLSKYYDTILNPFVTDVFTDMHMEGLPCDVKLMDELRELFHFTRRRMEETFKENMHRQARATMMRNIMQELSPEASREILPLLKTNDEAVITEAIKRHAPMEDIQKWLKRIGHLIDSPNFNIRSPDMMRRWLFDVEGLEPIKTTNQKAKGLPSMAWEKVLELPADRRRLYTPAVDKQTLQILSESFPPLDELLDLNAVGNLCKAFLKEADVYIDEETGEEVRSENGLHQWLATDNKIHGMVSLTETSRTRTWKPNSLNYPKYVGERIGRSVELIIREAHERGDLPESLIKWVGVPAKKLPSIRSCVTAPEGYCLVEFDYKTAEMVALSKISGDVDLMRILEEPDPEWAALVKDNPYKAKQVRVAFSDPADNGIPLSKQNPEFIMHAWSAGKHLGPVTEDMLARNPDGTVKHSSFDIHWSIAERIYEDGRENMDSDIQRAAGKVINFCVAENQLVLTKDRGEVPIQEVTVDDLLWDGDDWVSHEGVVFSGRKVVLFYEGLWATAEHKVWTCAGPMCLKLAIEHRRRLTRPNLPAGVREWGGSRLRCGSVRRIANTYDIVNAGPQNRFTCSGVLVSNSSAYGASPASLERKIESDTGVKPEPGVGQKGLDAIKARQPRASEFLEEMANLPKTKGYYRAASGRIRHCLLHGAGSGVGWRIRNSLESALGRELKNAAMQESVAATAARACVWSNHIYKRLGLRARILTCLYDSLVTICPLEERFVVSRIQEAMMSDVNTWDYTDEYGTRKLQYGVDKDFNFRWSTHPSEEDEKLLHDPDWHPTPDHLKHLLTFRNWKLLVS